MAFLADNETTAREEADRRRERAEELALQSRFDHFYFRRQMIRDLRWSEPRSCCPIH